MQDFSDSIIKFLDEISSEMENIGISTAELKVDHVAYYTSSTKEYGELLPTFLKEGKIRREAIVDGRRVAIIRLSESILWNDQKINTIELVEPKDGETTNSQWEHVEYFAKGFNEILKKYPDLDWIIKDKDRKEFAKIKLRLKSGRQIKFLQKTVLDESN